MDSPSPQEEGASAPSTERQSPSILGNPSMQGIGVIVAIIGIIVTIALANGDGSGGGNKGPDSGGGTSPSKFADSSQIGTQSVEPAWSGDVKFGDPGIALKSSGPTPASAAFSDIWYWGPGDYISINFGSPGALWEGSASPSWEDCRNLVNTQPISRADEQIPYRDGLALCLGRNGDNLAFIRTEGHATKSSINAYVVIWPRVQ